MGDSVGLKDSDSESESARKAEFAALPERAALTRDRDWAVSASGVPMPAFSQHPRQDSALAVPGTMLLLKRIPSTALSTEQKLRSEIYECS